MFFLPKLSIDIAEYFLSSAIGPHDLVATALWSRRVAGAHIIEKNKAKPSISIIIINNFFIMSFFVIII